MFCKVLVFMSYLCVNTENELLHGKVVKWGRNFAFYIFHLGFYYRIILWICRCRPSVDKTISVR